MRGFLIAAIGVCALLGACGHDPSGDERRGDAASSTDLRTTGVRFLGGGAPPGFARAESPREFSFPADHGSHDDFRSEWWYFTGNLDDAGGQHYGFEVTFFRIALQPEAATRESSFGTNQAWMAHFALTDVGGRRFTAAERFARGGALGLAGASTEPFKVWVKDWAVTGDTGAAGASFELSATDGESRLTLRLTSLKPPVAQGDRGLDAKGPEPGNASYYYSLTRLEATGEIVLDGREVAVTGNAWMDREWGTSALSVGVVGWDWFALQLADGRDIMYYRLRDAAGRATGFSGGALIDANGVSSRLDSADVRLTALETWESERTGVSYPIGWRFELPKENLVLDVEPYLADQEIDLAVRYWEGAMRVRGTSDGSPVSGHGYLELAGY